MYILSIIFIIGVNILLLCSQIAIQESYITVPSRLDGIEGRNITFEDSYITLLFLFLNHAGTILFFQGQRLFLNLAYLDSVFVIF